MFNVCNCNPHFFLIIKGFFFGSSGLTFKKLDKRLERTMLHSYRKVCSLAFSTPQQVSENCHEPVDSL
jgi:hypothetical protein